MRVNKSEYRKKVAVIENKERERRLTSPLDFLYRSQLWWRKADSLPVLQEWTTKLLRLWRWNKKNTHTHKPNSHHTFFGAFYFPHTWHIFALKTRVQTQYALEHQNISPGESVNVKVRFPDCDGILRWKICQVEKENDRSGCVSVHRNCSHSFSTCSRSTKWWKQSNRWA